MTRDENRSQLTDPRRTEHQAVVAARDADDQPDTTEIRGLARAAGYEVVDAVTQQRAADPTYGLGRGKAEKLMRRVAETDADAVVYDGELTPGQTFSLGELLPPGTDVLDRTRLVLDLFAEGADSRAASLQVELARLTYEKPRLAESIARDVADETRFNDEGDKRVLDVERRIETIERELAEITDDRAARRAQRREEGFDLVALAGYTNAGKSTLLHRLADDLDVGSATAGSAPGDPDPGSDAAAAPSSSPHADVDATASVANRLFETLDTTTRRATVGGRRLLVTDTVGFIDDLPHRGVESFAATLDSVRNADVVLLAVDVTDEPAAFGRKIRTALDAIASPDGPVVPVLTKVDRADPATVANRTGTVSELRTAEGAGAGDPDSDAAVDPDAKPDPDAGDERPVANAARDALREPVPVSAVAGEGVDALEATVRDVLPTERVTLDLPNTGATQSLLAWAYDHGDVEEVAYEGDRVRVAFAGNPSVVETATRKAARIEG